MQQPEPIPSCCDYKLADETCGVMVVYLHEALNRRLQAGVGIAPSYLMQSSKAAFCDCIRWSCGLFTSAVHVLLVTPVIFALMKERELRKHGKIEASHIAG